MGIELTVQVFNSAYLLTRGDRMTQCANDSGMQIPSKILVLVEQVNEELNFIEQVTGIAIDLTRTLLRRFPDNETFVQFFAYLNSTLLLVETDRRQIRRIIEGLSELDEITEDVVQDAGETLAAELGRIVEAKLVVSQIKSRLENL
jgi:GTP1/Obg family GTP-binding protein